ncbi:VanZ family protein [Schleiferiaceae bacterium]|nr:VanZ family protein [Schleiferiaceae bacterium]
MLNPWIYRAPAIGWGFLILYICLAPVEDLDPGFSIQISDKLVHFILYFSWVLLLYFASSRAYKHRLSRRKMLAYWIAAACVGGAVEFLQGAMDFGRNADVMDGLANTVGAITGIITSRLFHKILE